MLTTAVLRTCQNRTWVVAKKYLSSRDHKKLSLISPDRQQQCQAMLPEIIKSLTEDEKVYPMTDMNRYFSKMMNHLFVQDRYDYPVMQWTIASYEMLEKPERLTPENIKLAMYLAYSLESFQESWYVFDDLIDDRPTRRGLPTWHKVKGVELNAVSDGILLEQFGFQLFEKHFSQRSWYWSACDVLEDALLKVVMGQTIDGISTRKRGLPLSEFTLERVNLIATRNGCAVYAPIVLAMYLSDKHDLNLQDQIQRLSRKAGMYLQHKNDFEDCFGGSGQTGKDIQAGKCTWAVAKALELANPKQREVIDKNLGSSDPDASKAVIDVYKELNLEEVYKESKKDCLADIQKEILKIPGDESVQNLFIKFCNAFS